MQDILEAQLKGLLMFGMWVGRWATQRIFNLRTDGNEATSEMGKTRGCRGMERKEYQAPF